MGENALQYEVSMFGRCRGEHGPDMGNALLVSQRQRLEFLIMLVGVSIFMAARRLLHVVTDPSMVHLLVSDISGRVGGDNNTLCSGLGRPGNL